MKAALNIRRRCRRLSVRLVLISAKISVEELLICDKVDDEELLCHMLVQQDSKPEVLAESRGEI